jgi:hypothetical protein
MEDLFTKQNKGAIMKKTVKTLLGAALISALNVSPASAQITWVIEQVGADVVMHTDGGSLDISNLSYVATQHAATGFYGKWARISSTSGLVDMYTGFSNDNGLSSTVGPLLAACRSYRKRVF